MESSNLKNVLFSNVKLKQKISESEAN